MKRILYNIVLSLLCCLPCSAQPFTEVLDEHIATVEVRCGADGAALPVIGLGTGETFSLSFDDLSAGYRRFEYHIEHLTPNFQPTEGLFESEYVRSAAETEPIEEYDESIGTVQTYTHYRLKFPNQRLTPIVSGNYRLVVTAEDEDTGEVTDVLRVWFAVCDGTGSVSLTATTDTDAGRNGVWQQLGMKVNLDSQPLRSADEEVRTLVLQNRRTDNAVLDARPTYVLGNELEWSHSRDLIFRAGSQFRAFEMRSTRYPGMHQESVRWDGDNYQARLMMDEPLRSYLTEPDRNGQRVIRTDDGQDAATQGEYCFAHFTLHTDPRPDTQYYIYGQWTPGCPARAYRMTYDETAEAYTAQLYLKQGYYSYTYLCQPSGSRACYQADGDYWQTENEYAALVYYRPSGGRYWQLVAWTCPTFAPR